MKAYAILMMASAVALGCTGEITVDGRPRSLAGTDTDGALTVDDRGHFVADDDAMRLFDYFLTAEGEIDDGAIRALVDDAIAQRLSGDAAAEAMDAFARYYEYRTHSVQVLSEAGQSPEKARTRLHELYTSLVADLPGLVDEPVRIDRAFAVRTALSETCVEAATRVECVADVESRVAVEPDREAEARAASRIMLDLREAESRAAGTNAVRAVRMARVGAAATARLLELDHARAHWRHRLASYRAARAHVIQTTTPSPQRSRALDALLSDRFDATERRRVQALERSTALRALPAPTP